MTTLGLAAMQLPVPAEADPLERRGSGGRGALLETVLLPLCIAAIVSDARRAEALGLAAAAAGLVLGGAAAATAAAAGVAWAAGAPPAGVTAAAAVPAVARAAMRAAPRAFSTAEAVLLAGLALHGVCVRVALAKGGAGSGGADGDMTMCALTAAAALAGFALPAALVVSGWKSELQRTASVAAAGLAAVCAAYAAARRILSTDVEPAMHAVRYAFGAPRRRALLAYWALTLAVSLGLAVPAVTRRCRVIVARKSYHALALALFLPAVAVDAAFLSFATAVALAAMLAVEVLRVADVCRLGRLISLSVQAVRDNRDEGPLLVTHIYLLIGNGLPLWAAVLTGASRIGILAVSGMLVLDALDAAASIVGSVMGKTRLFGLGKTFEGTAAGVAAAFGLAAAWKHVVVAEPVGGVWYIRMLAAVAGAGLYEAATLQIDNLVLPIAFYVLLVAFGVD